MTSTRPPAPLSMSVYHTVWLCVWKCLKTPGRTARIDVQMSHGDTHNLVQELSFQDTNCEVCSNKSMRRRDEIGTANVLITGRLHEPLGKQSDLK